MDATDNSENNSLRVGENNSRPKWRKWAKVDRDLKEGEIIRLKLRQPNPKSPDGYIYGRVVGGFGMSKETMGRAIFVENEAWTFKECRDGISQDKARWNRDVRRIEVQEGEA